MQVYEVEYWQNTRYWVRVEAESEEEALHFVESWDEIDEDFYKEASSKEYDFSNVDKFLST